MHFQKGQSGNPAGRPRGALNRATLLAQELLSARVESIAGNLEKMPPKSTYFYPKLLSGLVFNSLKVS